MKQHWMKAAVAAAISLGAAGAQAGIVYSDSTYGVFDDSTGTRTFNVDTYGKIKDVNVTIDFAKCDDPVIGPGGSACIGEGHAWPEEIEFRLTSSSGNTISLVKPGTYQDGRGRLSITFDDEALVAGRGELASGTFRPAEALRAFDRKEMFGIWTLSIRDTAGGDPLEYFSASIEFNGGNGIEVPEPATAAMLGLGLAGIAAASRRKR